MKNSHITTIIFDYGGVLLEWDPRHLYRRFFPNQPEAMEQFLTEINFVDWNAQQDKGRPFAEAVESLSSEFPQHAHLIHAYDEHWEESVTGAITGSVEILKQLKAMKYPLYGLSNWSGETFQRARQKYDFFDLFDDMVISGDVKMIKPEPAIFELSLQKFGKNANECIYIDDSLPNITQAQKMGFETVHFQSPEQLRAELQRLEIL
jgi:2-haloacid dehalogenase